MNPQIGPLPSGPNEPSHWSPLSLWYTTHGPFQGSFFGTRTAGHAPHWQVEEGRLACKAPKLFQLASSEALAGDGATSKPRGRANATAVAPVPNKSQQVSSIYGPKNITNITLRQNIWIEVYDITAIFGIWDRNISNCRFLPCLLPDSSAKVELHANKNGMVQPDL